MDPLDNVNRVMGLLRERMGSRAQTAASGTRKQPSAPGAAPAATPGAPAAEADSAAVQARVVQRLKQLDRDDPRWPDRAAQALVEVVLLNHFGQARADDPQFHQLLQDVTRQMRADPALAGELDGVVRALAER